MKTITLFKQLIPFLLLIVSLNSFSQEIFVSNNSNSDEIVLNSTINIGSVNVGSSTSFTVKVTNTSSGGSGVDLTISSIVFGDSDFSSTSSSLVVAKNDRTEIFNIDFSPTSEGLISSLVTINSDAINQDPYTFTIQGTGVIPVPAPEMDIVDSGSSAITDGGGNSPSFSNNTDFGSTESGTVISKTFTIENNGNADLTLDDASPYVVITGHTGDFTLTANPSTPISGSSTTSFTIEFDPTTTGTRSAVISIPNNDADEDAYTFDIQGTGVLPAAEEDYIIANATWKYYDASNEPSNDGEGDTWKENAFDDGGWSSDNAPLGYGDMNGTGLSNINGSTEVAYFRNTFTVADHTIYNSLDLEAVRDDGMVVYVNGVEVWRSNMADGAVSYGTWANSVVGGSSEGAWITQSVQNALVTGSNVVAVEVHQENSGSSDISFNFVLTGSTAVVSPVTRGPYLQTGTSTSVIVKWRTSGPTDTKVNYGTSLGALNSTVSSATLTTNHEITLSGLTVGTKYYYELADAGGVYLAEDAEMYVVTAPTPGDSTTLVRAWLLGDAGTANTNQMNVRDAYYNYVAGTGPTGSVTNPGQTDMMIFLGDNAYNNGTDSEYQNALFDIYDEMLMKSVSWSTLGNHDGYSVDFNTQSGPYYDIFTFPTAGEAGGTPSGTEEYYSYDYANIHFIVLQSNNVDGGGTEDTFNTNQKAWLTTDINATTQDWIVAIFHHPPYTKGSHNSDNDGETGLQTMREQYLPILEAGGVDLTLSGHSHSYERSYFINGHTGYSNTFNSSQTTSGGHIVGTNGNLSGREDLADGAYEKTLDPKGAVYITAGSSGKATGASFSGDPYNASGAIPAMYYSAQSLGSTIIEVESDGSGGQNLNVKFLRDTGAIDDYFTIHKSSSVITVLATDSNFFDKEAITVYPVPVNDILKIKLSNTEQLQSVKFYNAFGSLVKESAKENITVRNLKTGVYLLEITGDKNTYYKSIIVE